MTIENYFLIRYKWFRMTRCLTGWEQGYQNEFDALSRQIVMSHEEVRLCKADIQRRNEELLSFYLVRTFVHT